jgi:hypothetical protein
MGGHWPMVDPDSPAPDRPISTLRGAGVNFDARRIGQVVGGLVAATLVVLIVVFTVAGAQKNSQITRLHQHGVAVEVTSTGCLGLLGGSGSNGAGYSCRGRYTFAGRTYTQTIPGNKLYAPGSTLKAIIVPGDPSLMSPVGIVANERSSGRVYLLPAILLFGLVLLVGTLLRLYRRSQTN